MMPIDASLCYVKIFKVVCYAMQCTAQLYCHVMWRILCHAVCACASCVCVRDLERVLLRDDYITLHYITLHYMAGP